MFEAHLELGDNMLDRGLSIVLCNVVSRQTENSRSVSSALLSLLHSVVRRCCTTNRYLFHIFANRMIFEWGCVSKSTRYQNEDSNINN